MSSSENNEARPATPFDYGNTWRSLESSEKDASCAHSRETHAHPPLPLQPACLPPRQLWRVGPLPTSPPPLLHLREQLASSLSAVSPSMRVPFERQALRYALVSLECLLAYLSKLNESCTFLVLYVHSRSGLRQSILPHRQWK